MAVLPFFLIIERFRVTFTVNVNLYHVAKFSLNWYLAIHYFYPKISRLTLVLSITIVWASFLSQTFSICSNSELEPNLCRLPQTSL